MVLNSTGKTNRNPDTSSSLVPSNVTSSFIDIRFLCHSVDVAGQVPLRLREGDVITMGSTELVVYIADLDEPEDQENVPSDA